MNYLAQALRRTYKVITKHWLLMGVLVLFQLALFVSLGYVGLTYQMKIFENIQGVLDPIQNANYNATSLQEGGLFTAEYARVYESYNSLVGNVKGLLIWILIIFLIGNGLIWVATLDLIHPETKSWKKRSQCWLKYVVLSVLILGLPLMLSIFALWQMMKAGIGVESITNIIQGMGYGLIGIYIILQIALAFISAQTWREFSRLFLHSFKKIQWILLTLIINLLVIAASIALVIFVMGYQNVILLVLASLIMVKTIVLSRIFWMAVLQELTHEREL